MWSDMAGRPPSYISQEWSVHAQLTISHQPTPPPARGEEDAGVRMEYSWAPGPGPRPCYGFQRGNIVFTTRPSGSATAETPGVYGSLPSRRPAQPYNRRCKSTCNITLSTDHLQQSVPAEEGCEVCGGERSPVSARRGSNYTTHFCTRLPDKTPAKHSQDAASQTHEEAETQTQTSSTENDKTRQKQESDKSQETQTQTVGGDRDKSQETQTQTVGGESDKYQETQTQTCSRESGRSQETQTQTQTCSIESGRSQETQTQTCSRDGEKTQGSGKSQQTPGESDLLQLPETGEEPPTMKSVRRLARSPARLSGKTPRVVSRKSSSHSPEAARHKPRTVHIDVYCTGSDASDSSSTSSSDSETGASWSSPQTVFESEKVRVTHTRVGKDCLPLALMKSSGGSEPRQSQSLKASSSREENSTRGYDSDDGLSSHYPSRFSSYTSFQDTGTSRDPSSSTISSSSCALSDSFDSVTATSWKDTVTDVESLLHSNPSLARSDSFDYADSIDRLRIRERERAWAAREESKTWRSPQFERRHMIQQQRLREFVEKRLSQGSFPLWKAGKSEESEDDGDETGDAWSFGGGSSSRVSTLKREDTVRKATPSTLKTQPPPADVGKELMPPASEIDSLSDTSPHVPLRRAIFPFVSRSPSPMPFKVESSITSPFTTRVGLRTDQLSKAERFGTIVGAFRKPGHHIGPSKNPECTCVHCRNYFFEQNECRGRTRSLDMSLEAADNWKMQLHRQIAEKKNAALRGKSEELRNYEDQWDDSNAV